MPLLPSFAVGKKEKGSGRSFGLFAFRSIAHPISLEPISMLLFSTLVTNFSSALSASPDRSALPIKKKT